jgi:subtilisin family serine protease
LAYYDDGLLLVAAAGNSGAVIYPAAYSSVIAVSATDEYDNLASFSSTGKQVELTAPGVDINSTLPGNAYSGETWSGTSMASPHVAGTAALIWATDDFLTNDEVRTQLQRTAEDIGLSTREQGYGLVDADEAAGVPPLPPNNPPVVSIASPADGDTFASGATISFSGTASDTEDGDLTDSLVWTSSIDGIIGITGGNFFTTLSEGTHTITAKVTDSNSETGSASIGITVGTSITYNMHVKSIDMSLKKAGINVNAIATVTIVDADGNLEGATVSGTWK